MLHRAAVCYQRPPYGFPRKWPLGEQELLYLKFAARKRALSRVAALVRVGAIFKKNRLLALYQ